VHRRDDRVLACNAGFIDGGFGREEVRLKALKHPMEAIEYHKTTKQKKNKIDRIV
jgi:hypothetical protein